MFLRTPMINACYIYFYTSYILSCIIATKNCESAIQIRE